MVCIQSYIVPGVLEVMYMVPFLWIQKFYALCSVLCT